MTFETLQLALRRATGQDELKLGDHVGFCADVIQGAQPSPLSIYSTHRT